MSATAQTRSHAPKLLAALEQAGFDFFAGVPCSLLKGLVSLLEQGGAGRYVPATREDSAVGLAAGAWLGGRLPVVLMQNSGLGVSVNALASLTTMYGLPVLLLVSWRGEGGNDAPEHALMGEITLPLLSLLRIPHRVLRTDEPMAAQVAWAKETMIAGRQPAALVVRAGILE